MPDMTAQTIIESAYRKNALSSLTTKQLNDGLTDLQNMLSSWSAEGLIVPSLVTENFTVSSGVASVTMGSGGDLNTVRPNRVMSAWIRVSSNDYDVDLMTRGYWVGIVNKTTTGRPKKVYYDPQYPLGKLWFDYTTDQSYDFHIISEKPLTNPALLTTTFSVPLEFNRAMIYNLAVELAPDNDNKLPPEVFVYAKESLDNIMVNNLGEREPNVVLDSGIIEYGSVMDINRGY